MLSHTKFKHYKAIQRHIDAFKVFFEHHYETIINQDFVRLGEDDKHYPYNTITYSENVKLNMIDIVNNAIEKRTIKALWRHFLVLTSQLVSTKDKTEQEILAIARSVEDDEENEDNEDNEKNEENEYKNGNGNNIIMGDGDDDGAAAATKADKVNNDDRTPPGLDTNGINLDEINKVITPDLINDVSNVLKNGMDDGKINIGQLMGIATNVMDQMGVDAPEIDKNSINQVENVVNNLLNQFSNIDPTSMSPMP